MKNYVTDTHPLIWWLLAPVKLAALANKCFDTAAHIYVPSITLLEIQYLNEINRIELDVQDVLAYISQNAQFEVVPFDGGVLLRSIELQATRDPFDRIIAGTALYWQCPLITKDRWMREHIENTVWN
jgi:PIN domain nuclease of toxin-antitoxin system